MHDQRVILLKSLLLRAKLKIFLWTAISLEGRTLVNLTASDLFATSKNRLVRPAELQSQDIIVAILRNQFISYSGHR